MSPLNGLTRSLPRPLRAASRRPLQPAALPGSATARPRCDRRPQMPPLHLPATPPTAPLSYPLPRRSGRKTRSFSLLDPFAPVLSHPTLPAIMNSSIARSRCCSTGAACFQSSMLDMRHGVS
ncbi:hypothetical protein BDW60DRAFT_143673 [Aspergillus nidulans var. acristatus]